MKNLINYSIASLALLNLLVSILYSLTDDSILFYITFIIGCILTIIFLLIDNTNKFKQYKYKDNKYGLE